MSISCCLCVFDTSFWGAFFIVVCVFDMNLGALDIVLVSPAPISVLDIAGVILWLLVLFGGGVLSG